MSLLSPSSERVSDMLERAELAASFAREALRELEFIKKGLQTQLETPKPSPVHNAGMRQSAPLEASWRSMSTGLTSARRSITPKTAQSVPKRHVMSSSGPIQRHALRSSPSRPRQSPQLQADEAVIIAYACGLHDRRECIFMDSNGKLGSVLCSGALTRSWPAGSILLGMNNGSREPLVGPVGFDHGQLYSLLAAHCQGLPAPDRGATRGDASPRYCLVRGQILQTHRITWHEVDTEMLVDIETDWPSVVIRKVKVDPSGSVPEETLGDLVNSPGTLMLLQHFGQSYRLIQWMPRQSGSHDDARSEMGSTGGRAFDPTCFVSSLSEL